MTLSDYRQSHSWKGAIDLGPQLMSLAEELPAAEELGLSWQLRQLMVEVPAAIAADLMYSTDSRRTPVLKLLAVLELIDRVYPALDTADTRKQADRLAEELLEDSFSKAAATADQLASVMPPVPAMAPPIGSGPIGVPVLPDAMTPVVPVPAPDMLQSVPVEPAPMVEPTRVTVQAESGEENQQPDVHPNSVE